MKEVDKKKILENLKKASYHDVSEFQNLSKKLKKDFKIVKTALKVYGGYALKFADKKFKANKKIVLPLVKRQPFTIKYADQKLRSDKDVVLAAVKGEGSSLFYASKKLQNDKKIVLTAVNQEASSLLYSSKKMKDDKDVVKAALKDPKSWYPRRPRQR